MCEECRITARRPADVLRAPLFVARAQAAQQRKHVQPSSPTHPLHPTMAALVSMAKAISSTLPSAPSLVQGATNAVKSAVGGTKDGIPAQLRKGLDVEALEAVESVEVDGTVSLLLLNCLVRCGSRGKRWEDLAARRLKTDLSSLLASQVLIKILKHFLDNPNSETSGQLLGLDLNSVLEVSDCFAFPQLPASERGADEEKERAAGRAARTSSFVAALRLCPISH